MCRCDSTPENLPVPPQSTLLQAVIPMVPVMELQSVNYT